MSYVSSGTCEEMLKEANRAIERRDRDVLALTDALRACIERHNCVDALYAGVTGEEPLPRVISDFIDLSQLEINQS